MPKPSYTLDAEHRSRHRASEGHHAVAGALFVVAWLSFVAFVALYRALLPADAFTALTTELVARADTASPR